MSPMMISLIIAAISYLLASSNGASSRTALATAALAGVGTYAVADGTEWGQKTFPAAASEKPVLTDAGSNASYPDGTPVKTKGTLTSWLSSNVAPLAIGAAAGSAGSGNSGFTLLLIGALVLFVTR